MSSHMSQHILNTHPCPTHPSRWELYLRKAFLASRNIPTAPYVIYLVLLRWLGLLVFVSYQFTMLASILASNKR